MIICCHCYCIYSNNSRIVGHMKLTDHSYSSNARSLTVWCFSRHGQLHIFAVDSTETSVYTICQSTRLILQKTAIFMVAILTTSNITYIYICLLHCGAPKNGNYSCCRDVKGKRKLFPVHSMQACRESGGLAPFIVNLGIRWRRMCSFTIRPVYPRVGTPVNYGMWVWVGPTPGLEVSE